MEFAKPYFVKNKATVTLFSEPSDLSLYIVENLLENFCRIKVVSININGWKNRTTHIAETKNLVFIEETKDHSCEKSMCENSNNENSNYNIFINLYPSNMNLFWKEIVNRSRNKNKKSLVITSYKSLIFDKHLDNIPENISIVYVGDLIGPRLDADKYNPIARLIDNSLKKGKEKVVGDEQVFPVFLGDVAKAITKSLFSFGNYGEEILLIGRSKTMREIADILRKYLPLTSISYYTTTPTKRNKRTVRIVNINTNIEAILGETIKWFGRNVNTKEVGEIKYQPYFIKSVLIVALILISPYLLAMFSVLMLYVAKIKAEQVNFTGASRFIQVSFMSANISNKITNMLQKIPIAGGVYNPLLHSVSLVKSADKIAMEVIEISYNTTSFLPKILGDEAYNVNDYSEKILLDASSLERELQYLESEVRNYQGFARNRVIDIFEKINFSNIKKIVGGGKDLIASAPEILGTGSKKTYLLLFQNNMELRPTGGFIGSFALVTFLDGRFIDMSVQDVYTADGQLRGHVEPPYPIKKYLNEAGWYLRDANWDPDFPASAEKIEWFLDKELDIPVDGVIAIDLHFVKDLIKEIGVVFLKDYQMEITAENLYEKVQTEVQSNFFPGSSRKASFLTALSREILTEISTKPIQNYVGVITAIYKNIDQRHIQIFLHDNNARVSLAEIGWDGAVEKPNCGINCYSDWFGVNEANLGVNKANYFINREYFLNVDLQKNEVIKKLSINYENNANSVIGDKGTYKVYLRLMAPLNSRLIYAQIQGGGEVVDVYPDETSVNGRRELGFYFEILPQQKREFNISWENDIDLTSELESYLLLWRKQAGIEDSKALINIEGTDFTKIHFLPKTALTAQGKIEYNTIITRDFVSRIFLK